MQQSISDRVKHYVMSSYLMTMMMMLYSAALTGDRKEVLETYTWVMKDVKKNHNAFAAILIGSIMAVIVGSIMLYIGLYVNATVVNSIPAVNDSAYNATLTTVKGNVNTAFTLLGIILIVGGAGGIIAVLLGFVGSTASIQR